MSESSDSGLLSRRSLLGAGAGAALAGVFALRRHATASRADYDVVIVGAGAAGIAAAQTLKKAGRSYVIVEALDRIGGRAWTDSRTFGVPFDIGCAWLHAGNNNPFKGFAEKLRVPLHEHSLDLNGLYYGPERQSAEMLARVHAAEEEIGKQIKAACAAGEDVAASTVATQSERPFDAARTYMGPMDAAVDFRDFSTADDCHLAEYDPNYLVPTGFGDLVARVAALEGGVAAHTGTRVTAIRYDGHGVKVSVEGRSAGTISAKAAIVTVSTGVLATNAISFYPALPAATRDAIAGLPMGLLTKIPLLLHEKIDGGDIKPYQNILDESAADNRDIYFLAWPFDTRLMVGFAGGQFAWDLAKAGQRAAVDFATARLKDLFGSSVPAVERGIMTPWGTHPRTLGAYSAASPGHYAARAALAEPVDERVYFAARRWRRQGSMPPAAAPGCRAPTWANTLIQNLKCLCG